MQFIEGIQGGAQKVVVYGPEGIGKSTFAARFPDPRFIDTEGSTKHLNVKRTPKPTSWSMLLGQVEYFVKNPGICKTLVIDTADWAEILCVEHICAKAQVDGLEGYGYGKGYIYLAEEFGRLLAMLEKVVEQGTNVVMTAHAQMRKFEQPDEMGGYDRWELKLQKKTAPLVKEWADTVLFANYKTHVVNVDNQGAQKGRNKVQGGRRVMYTAHHPCWDAKNRQGLAEELPFDYGQIAHCIEDVPAAPPPQPQPASPALPAQPAPQVPTQQPAPAPTPPAPPPEPQPTPPQQAPEPPVEFSGSWPPTGAERADEPPQPPADPPDMEGVPQALRDLMAADGVTVAEIQEAVAKRGYLPADTPIKNYDPAFVEGCLIAGWKAVLDVIENQVRDMPF